MPKKIITIILKLILLVLILTLGVFYLRLGWFLYIVWAVGLVVAIQITRSQTKALPWAYSTGLVVLIYILSVVFIWSIFIDQKSYKNYQMTWSDKGSNNNLNVPEIVLNFKDHPDQYVGIYSQEVADYLHPLPQKEVSVTFSITSDFGCLRGFYYPKIGELTSWVSMFGYASVDGNVVFGKSPWWCP